MKTNLVIPGIVGLLLGGMICFGTYSVYVTFASVYATAFVMATGQTLWGLALVALSLARFASGVLIK